MAKPKKRKKHKGGGGRPVGPTDIRPALSTIVQQLDLAGELEGPVWGQVHQLLLKSPLEVDHVTSIIANRDRAALDLILAAEDLAGFDPRPQEEPEPVVAGPKIENETKKKAMRAFKRKLKYARLDDESRLGVGPMTGGKSSEINAIIPPMEFERAVWEALSVDGRLRDMKQGFFELNESADTEC